MYILQVAALATLSPISTSEQVTALMFIQLFGILFLLLVCYWYWANDFTAVLLPTGKCLSFFMTQSENFLDLRTSNSSIWAPEPHLGAPWTASLLGPVPAQEQELEAAFIYFSAITSPCRLEVLSMVHLLPPRNVTLLSSAIYFLHQQELPVARCFPWESEKYQPELSP